MKEAKYTEALGRRKTSIARVRITPDSKNSWIVNGKNMSEYFVTAELEAKVKSPIEKLKIDEKYKVTIMVSGGGISSQAEATRMGLSRALVLTDHSLRSGLKKEGYLKRDARAKERRKFGLKKARKAPQWSKR